MFKKIIVSLSVVVSALIATRLLAAPSPKPVLGLMAFAPANSAHWNHDDDSSIDFVQADHFLYKGSEAIDLNIIRDGDDLDNEIIAKGKDAVVAQIVTGQDKINRMFDVGLTKVLSSELEQKDLVKVLTLSTQQDLPDGRVERIEKYFISPGQTLHAELRWHLDADAAAISDAKKEFADARFEVKEQ